MVYGHPQHTYLEHTMQTAKAQPATPPPPREVVVPLGSRGSRGTQVMNTGFARCTIPVQIHGPPGEVDHLLEADDVDVE